MIMLSLLLVENLSLIVVYFVVVVIVSLVIKTILKNDLSPLIKNDNNVVSQSRFWSNLAFLVATVAFIKVNYTTPPPSYLVEIWVIYLSALTGNRMYEKYIVSKQQRNKTPKENDLD